MIRIPLSPPEILSLSSGKIRPLWSVMIPVYNNLNFLEEAITSVLLQNIPQDEMQVEVIDDASTDGDVKSLVDKIGKGRITYFKQPANVGSLRNFETCINRSNGHLVHILHADDKVRNGYYKTIGQLLEQHPDAGAAFCRFSYITEKGKEIYNQTAENLTAGVLDNWLLKIAGRQRVQYVAITVRRKIYEELGSFYGLTYGEDWEMWVRIAKHFPVAYTPEILAEYRKHKISISGKKFLNGDYLSDLAAAMQMIQHHLPQQHKQAVLQKSKKFYSHYALKIAHQLWITGQHKKIVRMNIKKGWQMHKDLPGLLKIIKINLKIFLNWR